MTDDKRIEMLAVVRRGSPLTLDTLEWLSQGLDDNALATFCGNVSTMPQNIQSRLKP